MMCASESEGAVCEVGIAHLNYSLWILGRASRNLSPGVHLRDCPVLAIACGVLDPSAPTVLPLPLSLGSSEFCLMFSCWSHAHVFFFQVCMCTCV